MSSISKVGASTRAVNAKAISAPSSSTKVAMLHTQRRMEVVPEAKTYLAGLARSQDFPSGVRAYHPSLRASASADTSRSNAQERRKIPASSWSRPHKPSQDAHDDVVPTYYVERKRQRDAIEQRKDTEGNLMAQLSAGILSEGIAAQTRVRENKVPAEVVEEDGTVRLASGFEPPTPATEFHPVTAISPAEDGSKVSWHEALEPVDASAAGSTWTSSTPSGTRGLHTSATARAVGVPRSTASERRKIPASAWSRPHKPSQDAHDDVVPAYYVERKLQRDAIEQRKDTEGSLMAQLSAGILSEGIAAQTRVRENKIPVEVLEEDGTVRLASGFEPPTPATEFHHLAAMAPAKGDTPLVALGQMSWDESLAAVDAPLATARPMSSGPPGAHGFHTRAAKQTALNESMESLAQHRARYMDTLAQQTSWRPMLTATFPRSQ
ncbi:hypothetical protein PHLGIDRAFT_129021 [Phlebiopsis gigantea 11061_1 CR5-6]|uniref:Uncharacterized protein n=1 Tax=Phlebiopsis gigantea (strain 11061_1 CR5-6) TaxID=745531 RepID=A0A0C3S8C8_PHLG1|nr:hypothetical protein PHLGIDRAFT_129021 [Phlebiopsis gigantea 11061_1 CR5-6]